MYKNEEIKKDVKFNYDIYVIIVRIKKEEIVLVEILLDEFILERYVKFNILGMINVIIFYVIVIMLKLFFFFVDYI